MRRAKSAWGVGFVKASPEPGGVDRLKGARHITIGGHFVYVVADAGLVILNLDDPLHPKVVAEDATVKQGTGLAVQFRAAFHGRRGRLLGVKVQENVPLGAAI